MSLLKRFAPELARSSRTMLNPWNDMLRDIPYDLYKRLVTIDLSEKSDHFIIEAEVPGFKKEDLFLEVEGTKIRLKGDYQHNDESKDAGNIFSERTLLSFDRQIELPSSIDPTKITASLSSGVLKVVVAKDANSQKTSIPIE